MATAVEADDPSSSPREGGSARAGSRQSDAGSESPTMPVWAQRLPCCLQAPIKRLYVDLLLPGDSFDVSMRKLLVAMGPIIFFTGPFAVGIGLPISGGLDSSGSWLMFVTLMLWGPLWFGLYFRARCNKARGGDGIMGDLWAGVTAVGLAILSIGMPTGPWHVASAEAVLFAFMIRAPRRWVIAIIGFATAMISIYNQQAFSIGTVELPLIAIPDQYIDGRAGVRHLWQYVVYLVMVPLCGLLEAVSRESERRQEAAKDSLDLATLLAAALSRYDTAAAAEAIATARSGASQVDETLLDEFASIVRNLDEYKPHLPNWLVDKHSKVTSPDEDDGSGAPKPPERAYVRDDMHTHSSRSSTASSIMSQAEGRNPNVPFVSQPAASLRSRSVRAVAAELDVAFGDISRQPGRQTTALLHAFVDRVHRVANETRAAVHTFVGDTVVASWNAAAPVAQAESRAARFVARVRAINLIRPASGGRDHDQPRSIGVTGVVLSGHALALVAGLGDQRGLALSFAPERVEAHRLARVIARERDAVLVTGEIAKAAEFATATALTAILPGPGMTMSLTARRETTPRRAAMIRTAALYFAVLGEYGQTEDDWMCLVNERDANFPVAEERSPSASTTSNALGESHGAGAAAVAIADVGDLCEAGDFCGALRALAQCRRDGITEERAAALEGDIRRLLDRTSVPSLSTSAVDIPSVPAVPPHA